MKENNDIEMYSTHNEGKSVIAKRFTRTWKSKIYKYMTSVSKTVYIDKLDETVNNYNKTYHTAVKIKPVDVKSNKYIDSIKEFNNKKPKFTISDTVRISKSFFQKVHSKLVWRSFCNWKIENTAPWTYVINDLNGEEILGTFYGNKLQKNKLKRA